MVGMIGDTRLGILATSIASEDCEFKYITGSSTTVTCSHPLKIDSPLKSDRAGPCAEKNEATGVRRGTLRVLKLHVGRAPCSLWYRCFISFSFPRFEIML